MINWKTISLDELAGFLSEKLRKRGIDTVLEEIEQWATKEGFQEKVQEFFRKLAEEGVERDG